MNRRILSSFYQRVMSILNGNLKTINGNTIVGEGDIPISGTPSWGSIGGTLSSQTDLQTALNGKENLIVAGTISQYFRGDKTFQTLDKNAVGLSNVDDTSDINKPVSTLQASAIALKQDTLVSGTNIKTINSNSLLGSGDLTISASPSGLSGQIQFNNAGSFGADSNLFWDNTNKRLGIGATPSTSVRLDVRSQGALSTDTAFRIRNSANSFDLLSINGVGLISGRTDGAGGFNMNYQGTINTTIQLTFNNGNPTLRVANNTGGHAFNVYTSTNNREYLAGLIGKATFAIGANPLAGTIKPNEANTNTMYVFNGTAPTLSATDSFNLYAADIVAGNSAPHFRTENGSVIKLYQETTAIGSSAFVQNTGNSVNDASTFDGYTIAKIVKALRTQGLLA